MTPGSRHEIDGAPRREWDSDKWTVPCECGWRTGEHRQQSNAIREWQAHHDELAEPDDEAGA